MLMITTWENMRVRSFFLAYSGTADQHGFMSNVKIKDLMFPQKNGHLS
jgi:hypothetical protein